MSNALEALTGGVDAPPILTPAVAASLSGKQLVTIKGALAGGHEEQTLTAILGNEGVTTTAGWAKWAKPDRRQRTSLTVLEGYEPYTITVPILLDARRQGMGDVENLCAIIEWFGGRGSLFKGKPGHPGEGEPPFLGLTSESHLVPHWVQTKTAGKHSTGNPLYVLDGLEYNMFGREWIPPRRNGSGDRTRQAANLTLLQFIPSKGAPDSAVNRAKALEAQEHKHAIWIVHDGVNTFYAIAKHYNRSAPAEQISRAAREIQEANSKYGASVKKLLPHGAKIRVPESATGKRIP